ncbi:MAG TPA: SRPBCC family protein [Amycolatopsis sp.]|uniref:SRPBCC family protein n=1 Tax=Amycolatopsis sp. TaxID=37632 RepID=UPI002B489C21|nr:SRPBCC family protein [Amycolatopsis sp.]HKS47667.1 SRPBCC family protein [Amycolatopsis sp.]
MDAKLETISGNAVLRFERRFAHPVEKVWRAVTDPAEMAHWFPAAIETELKAGAKMRFVFPDQAPIDDKTSEGEVLEFDPPKVYAFRWNEDVLRFELVPEGDGCRLYFSQTLGGGPLGRLAAGRNASGWDTCLESLAARLDNRAAAANQDWLGPMLRYVEKFGLDQGEVTADGVRFVRDLVWRPLDDAWARLTDGRPVAVGDAPPAPAAIHQVRAGQVTRAEAPHVLEYEWRHDGEVAGRVRWEFVSDGAIGVRVEVTQTIPERPAGLRETALEAWRTRLGEFFTSLFSD